MTADLVTTLTGKEPLRPARVVRFLRVRRRRLRAVKYQGLRTFQSWQKAEMDIRQVGLNVQFPTQEMLLQRPDYSLVCKKPHLDFKSSAVRNCAGFCAPGGYASEFAARCEPPLNCTLLVVRGRASVARFPRPVLSVAGHRRYWFKWTYFHECTLLSRLRRCQRCQPQGLAFPCRWQRLFCSAAV
jgi:hypothetical protein